VGSDSPFFTGAGAALDADAGEAGPAGTSRAWHLSQYTLAGGFMWLHMGHTMPVFDGSLCPQSLQKREPSRLAVPQFGQ